MTAGDWNFMAGRLDGDGSVEILEPELPINVTAITQGLSAPSGMTGSISMALERLKSNGNPVFEPWNTVILAVADDVLRGYTLYRKPSFDDTAWNLDQIGLSGYPSGMPYDGSVQFIGADPLDIFRHIWNHLQTKPYGNLGVTIDDTTSTVKVGIAQTDVAFDTSTGQSVAFEAGPRKLNWWSTKDLGQEIDNYAAEAPFDWAEQLSWSGDQPHCHIRLGYPQIGGRKEGMRLVLGENLATMPTVGTGDFANQAWVLGAGEGQDMIRGTAGVSDGRIRRIKVVEEKSQASVGQATTRARDILNRTRGQFIVDQLEVYDQPDRPLAAIELGDEIPLVVETNWVELNTYVRVIGRSDDPTKGDRATLTVVRESIA